MKILLFAAMAVSAASGDFVSLSNRAANSDLPEAKIELYSRALKSWTPRDGNRNKGVVLANRAAIRHQLGDYEGAVEDLSASMKVLGKSALTLANRGAALASLGRRKEAVADFTEAIRADPRNPTHYASRAIANDAMEKTEQAILDYDTLLSLDPAFKDGRKTRGSLLFKAGRFAEAVADFDAAIKQNRNDRRAYQLKALAEAAIDQNKKNIEIQARNREMKKRAAAPARQRPPELPFKLPDIDFRIWLFGGGLLLLGLGIRALK